MGKYNFEVMDDGKDNNIVKVSCESEDIGFCIMIDTWDDPFKLYFSSNDCHIENMENFRKQLFDFLVKEIGEDVFG